VRRVRVVTRRAGAAVEEQATDSGFAQARTPRSSSVTTWPPVIKISLDMVEHSFSMSAG
jgi:hypothetical protein